MRLYFLCAAVMAASFISSGANARTCAEVLYYYRAGLPPKAYAASASGKACGYATLTSANTLEIAQFRAMMFCQQSRGKDCHIVYSQAK
jgi:hypothetical protein